MAGDVRLIARIGPRVTKDRFATLGEALAELERRVAGVGRAPDRNVLGREYEAVRQVTGRFELRGSAGRGGLDVRGDGSAEAYTGWIRKQPVERQPGESAVAALGRALSTR